MNFTMKISKQVILQSFALRKEYPFRNYSVPYFPAPSYSVQMQENTDQNNSKYGHFSRSVVLYMEGHEWFSQHTVFESISRYDKHDTILQKQCL